MAHPRPVEPRFSYAEYVQWADGLRWELIDGVARVMSPAPARSHQELLIALAGQVWSALEGQPCRVYVAPFDVRLAPPGTADEDIVDVVQLGTTRGARGG